ncbi:MAG: Lytic transglycosylase catalytic [Myxococcales bacterium]|nr:Lytic transglycosylase catalytic [Myxococcales bacterium]
MTRRCYVRTMRRTVWLVVVLVACSGDDSHRHVAASQQGSVVPPAPVVADAAVVVVPPGSAPLSEQMATSYWTTANELEGATQFALHNWKAARDAFALARTGTKDDDRAARIELMLGLCEAQLENWPDAKARLSFAYDHLPLLANYIGYQTARAAWLAHDGTKALELAQKIERDSIVGPDAEILVGDLLRDKSDWPAVAAHFRDYLTRHPEGPFRSEARYDLADALEQTLVQRQGSKDEIVKLYRQIEIDDPLSSWKTKAHDKLVALKANEKLDAAEQIAQAKVLFDNMRNPESEAAFDAALAEKTISAADKCVAAYHRAQSRFKARDRKGAAPMFDDAATACKLAKNTDLEIKSNYQAARSYSFFGEHEIAIERYQTAQAIDPKHSYADDSMLREAEEWASLNDGKKVEEVLSALPTKFPDGDNTAEAMWRLGFRAWREQRYDDAIKWWREQIRLVPHDDNWFGEGEPQYWLGRAYAAKKQPKEAIESWTAAVRGYPAAYYALLSLNRIRETSPKQYEALVAEIAADPAGYDPKAPAFSFKPRPEWAAPGFQRAMELLRLGLGEPAEHELRKLGLTAPGDRKPVTDPDKQDKLWALAFLYDRAGRYATSHWPTRWHILDYRKQWPTGSNRARWQIAYPKAYWELLNRHAKLNNVPIAMQIGIVREESAFDPLDESYANAIGLTQMIPPTAKDFAKGTGIDPTRENLRDPEKNVTIGSRFLGSLYKTWNNFTLLVPPSYNAGPAGVRRMLRVRGSWDADEFVEGIVDDQARNYTKRVLGSFFTYTWLYQHEVPEIPNTFPKDLLPKP